ncbi:MAG: carboxypeptidase regulatory-like domain-containing protein [Bacillota bacterium]
MKRTAVFLLLICLLLNLTLCGCSQSGSTEGTATPVAIDKTPIDFSLSSADLDCGNTSSMSRSYVLAGYKMTLQAKVHKNTSGTAGGGTVKFLLDGQQVDSVPFYMDAGENSEIVKAFYVLPLDKYFSLAKDQQVPLRFEARVEPDAIHEDTDATNNSAQIDTAVKGKEHARSMAYSDASIVALEVSSDAGSNVAKPGDALRLKARIKGNGGYARIRYFVNGSLIADERCSVPKSGAETLKSIYYYVPWDSMGELDCRAVLGNGEEAGVTIPVERYDYEVHNQDIAWEYSSVGRIFPGDSVSIRCRIHRNSRISFAHTSDTLRVVFIVNGTPSEPVKVDPPSGTAPYMGDAYYAYKVPEGQNGPLDVKVIVDALGFFNESDEGNNLASATIPPEPQGGTGLSLSIAGTDLWVSPATIVPGEKVELMAAVHNNAAGNSPVSAKRVFTVNGQQLDPMNTNLGTIKGGQYKVTYEMWTVPEGLTSDPVFTVTIDPEHKLAGEDPGDNQATLTLKLARPDLAAGELAGTGADTAYICSGRQAKLTASVCNRGPVAASGVKVNFIVDGNVVGSNTVDVPAYATVRTSILYDVPAMKFNTAAGADITGVSGYVRPKAGEGKIDFSIGIDPDNQIQESDENNNTKGPVPLSVTIPSQVGRVYVQVQDSNFNDVGGATVNITAGAKQCSAVTDSHGCCTFNNVPFGAYEAAVNKAGYNEGKSYGENLYEGNYEDYTYVYLDNKAKITGRITKPDGTPLEGVSVQAKGENYKTATDSSGNYTLSLPAGQYTIQYRKTGYEKADADINPTAASSLAKNITMSTTNLAYVYGCVYDRNGKPMPGMRVDAVNVNKTVLVTTTTGADGCYRLNIPLTTASMDAGIQVEGQGLYALQGVFLDQGLEDRCDISFVPASDSGGEGMSSIQAKVSPWVECASMPGTFFNPDYEVRAIYGMFKLDTYVLVQDSSITHLEINTDPDYWLYSSVSSSWSPTDVLEVDEITEAAIDVASFVLPLDIPISVGQHSANHTKVRIKKIAIMSDGAEVGVVYPNAVGNYAYSPDTSVNWSNCRIKYYIKVDPDNGVVNPAAGYGKDRVLVEWDPKEKKFTKIGSYVVTGWDEAHMRETYMDEE